MNRTQATNQALQPTRVFASSPFVFDADLDYFDTRPATLPADWLGESRDGLVVEVDDLTLTFLDNYAFLNGMGRMFVPVVLDNGDVDYAWIFVSSGCLQDYQPSHRTSIHLYDSLQCDLTLASEGADEHLEGAIALA